MGRLLIHKGNIPRYILCPIIFLIGLLYTTNLYAEDRANPLTVGEKKKSVLILKEQDQDGGERKLKKKINVADINSIIIVKINKDSLRDKIGTFSNGTETEQLLNKARILRETAAEGLSHLPALQAALQGYLEKGPDFAGDSLDPLMTEVGELIRRLTSKELAPEGSRLNKKINDKLTEIIKLKKEQRKKIEQEGLDDKAKEYKETAIGFQAMLAQYQVVFETAAEESERLNAEFDGLLKKDGVYILLGAFIANRPVHLPGFDTYPTDDTYEVSRFNLALTDEQKKESQLLADTAKEMNEELKKKSLAQVLLEYQEKNRSTLLDSITSSLGTLPDISKVKDELDNVSAAYKNDKSKLERLEEEYSNTANSAIERLKDKITSFENTISYLKGKYGANNTLSAAEMLIESNSDILNLLDTIQKLPGLVKEQKTILEDLLKESDVKKLTLQLPGALQSLTKEVDSFLTQVRSFGDDSLKNVQSLVKALVNGSKVNDELLALGDKVLKHDIDSIPTETELYLINTGVRKAGDSVTIKLASGRADEPVSESRKIETRQIQLFQVLPHIETAVNLIFARHEDSFQAAPSYSFLYKFGSRSPYYNRLIDIGIGLNIAALDFNKDDELEIGVGGVISLFKDYVQGGYGFNINDDSWYYFFGLKLPLPSR